jgi:hypothetical protein
MRGAGQQFRAIYLEAAAPLGLGVVQRRIGRAQQRFDRIAMLRIQRNAGAEADDEIALIDAQGCGELAQDVRHEVLDCFGAPDGRNHQREFIAAETAQESDAAGCLLQPRRDGAQHAIAVLMSERVVDRLEVVDVQIQHGAGQRLRPGAFDRQLEPLVQVAAVGQLGQRIMMREVPQVLGALRNALFQH